MDNEMRKELSDTLVLNFFVRSFALMQPLFYSLQRDAIGQCGDPS